MKTLYIVCLALLMGGGLTFALKKCTKKEPVTQLPHVEDSSRYYKDQYGAEHAVNQQIIGNRKDLELFYNKRIDSLCKRISIKQKQLKDMAKLMAQVHGSFVAPLRPVAKSATIHDTIPGEPTAWEGSRFNWQDSFLTVNGFVNDYEVKAFYSMEMPISITTYWKRRWFLGKKRYYIDGFSSNNNVHLTGLSGVKIN